MVRAICLHNLFAHLASCLLTAYIFCVIVYSPTQNIVYHNYSPNPDGHGTMEWMKPWKQRLRDQSLRRIRTYLELPNGIDEMLKLDNLGIYGLGKRRTLQQLNDFVGIDLTKEQSRPSSVSSFDNNVGAFLRIFVLSYTPYSVRA